MNHLASSVGGWFAQLPAADRAALHVRGTARHYRPGSTLFHEGDPSNWLVLLSQGRVKVSAATSGGHEVVLAIRGPGDLLGDLSAFDAKPRSATVTAIDAVDCHTVTADDFRDFVSTRPEVSLAFIRSMSGRLRDSDRRRVEFVALDTIGRVATRLVELAERYGACLPDGTTLIDIDLTQDELAGLTGASREAVGRALHLFRRRAWITTARRRITVVDLAGLRSRST